jgi:ABC-type branched-subunit amino acid transport system ATPase component
MTVEGLKIKNVSKSINGIKIIDTLTASFQPGKITALIGPNGAGKTTLFNLITGELKLDEGNILHQGMSIMNMPPYKLARKGIGRLFQDVRIFEDLTVFENVATSCYSHTEETPWFPFFNISQLKNMNKDVTDKAHYWLDKVGLLECKKSKASKLSFGQQKLLAIARLLAGNFSLLLLDEPTAGLNTVMIDKLLNILQENIQASSNTTIIIVEHNMGVVMDIANWVYFMNEGRVAFFGRTDHVLGDRVVRETYLGL